MNPRGESGREVARWAISGVVVLCVHVGAMAAITNWPQTASTGSPEATIMLDMSSELTAPNTEKTDVAPDPVLQQQADKQPEPEKEVEKEPEPDPPQKVEPPQKAEVELPPPPKPAEKPVQKKVAALNTRPVAADKVAPQATTPSPGALGAAKAEYGSAIVAHLNKNKNYPSGARSRHEEGTVMLNFVIDRGGRVLSSRIVRGSGFPELDQETLEMLRRAQPFPTPPPDLRDATFVYTAPMRYYLR